MGKLQSQVNGTVFAVGYYRITRKYYLKMRESRGAKKEYQGEERKQFQTSRHANSAFRRYLRHPCYDIPEK
jgi:hypothetical protein